MPSLQIEGRQNEEFAVPQTYVKSAAAGKSPGPSIGKTATTISSSSAEQGNIFWRKAPNPISPKGAGSLDKLVSDLREEISPQVHFYLLHCPLLKVKQAKLEEIRPGGGKNKRQKSLTLLPRGIKS